MAIVVAAFLVTSPALAQSPVVTASVDSDSPYLGQQITYTLKVYQGEGLPDLSGQVSYEPPAFAGFWNSQTTEQREYSETIDSVEYSVNELRTVIFPSIVGGITIAPASLAASGSSNVEPAVLESAPLTVEVRPLPSGAPPEFTGAVGTFEISAEVDATTGAVNQPVRFTVTVSGNGNIEALPEPSWPEFAGWRVVESPVSFNSRVVAGQVTGSRTYELTLVPEVAGELTIPAIPYPYFEPVSEQFVPVATVPIVLSIAETNDSTDIPPVSIVSATQEEGPVIRPIKPVPPSLHRAGTELTSSSVYWAAWAIPALAVVGALAWRRRRASLDATRAEALRQSAFPDAKAALAHSAASGDDPRVAAASALLSYLSARLAEPVGGLTREALLRRLREAGVLPQLAQKVEGILSAGDAAGYTPMAASATGGQDYASDAVRLLEELEEVIGR